MIRASIIYAIITVLLALIDAIRIKKAKGVVENINHKVSDLLGTVTAVLTCIFSHSGWQGFWMVGGYVVFTMVGFVFIRLAFYDVALNLWRRMKIDYESPTTSSYVDQHTGELSFLQKRALAVCGWLAIYIMYHIIFEK